MFYTARLNQNEKDLRVICSLICNMCIGFIVKLWFKLKSSKTMENKSKKLIKECEKTT